MDNIFWKGICHYDRTKAISELESIINTYGFITDFKQYSDLFMMLKIEIEEHKIDQLYEVLQNIIQLDKAEKLNSSSTKERVVFLNVSFTKGTGNLRIEVPSVPG